MIKCPNCSAELKYDVSSESVTCEYCGSRYSNLQSLTSGSCSKSPSGKHVPYEGDEKSQYYCEYCGSKYSNLQSLTSGSCSKSPTRKHHPAR